MFQFIPNYFALDLNFDILKQIKLLPQLWFYYLQSIILIRFRDINDKILLKSTNLELKLKFLLWNIEDINLKVLRRWKTLELLLRVFSLFLLQYIFFFIDSPLDLEPIIYVVLFWVGTKLNKRRVLRGRCN